MECIHNWIVTTDDDNRPEDIMCSKCKEVTIFIKYDEDEDHLKEGADYLKMSRKQAQKIHNTSLSELAEKG